MFNIGPQELLVILLVALVIVGPKRLPELSRTIGRGLREFRKAQDEVRKTISLGLDEEPAKPGPESSRKGAPGTTPADGRPDEPAPATEDASEASATATASDEADIRDVAKSLGRGLAELRRTRQEIQRTFRVDLSDRVTPPAPTAPEADATVPPDEPAGPSPG